MIDYRMRFYVNEDPEGNYHVQNAVAGLLGQHHVHSPESYARWLRESDDITIVENTLCDCGLNPGDVKEHDGRVWHNEKFE